jgi:hypothetical protein
MGFPCDEILGNHSKGLPGRFYTLWAESCLLSASPLMQRPVMAGRHADHFAEQPREVIHIVIAQLLSDLPNALLAFVEQAAGMGHFQLDKVLNRRMAGQCAVGFGEVKTRKFELHGQGSEQHLQRVRDMNDMRQVRSCLRRLSSSSNSTNRRQVGCG